MGQGYVEITTGLILAANPQRISVVFVNKGSDKVHIGQTAMVGTDAPYLLPDSTWTEDSGGDRMYLGPYYGITTGGTAVVYYWERTR